MSNIEFIGLSGPVNVGVWEVIARDVAHPRDDLLSGFSTLVRCRNTGLYALTIAGVFRSVPQDWARKIHAVNVER